MSVYLVKQAKYFDTKFLAQNFKTLQTDLRKGFLQYHFHHINFLFQRCLLLRHYYKSKAI